MQRHLTLTIIIAGAKLMSAHRNMAKSMMVASLSLIFLGVAHADPSEPQPELVMREGARIEAKTEIGTITVIAGNSYDRQYSWNGCTLDASMHARRKRWHGIFGIYDVAQWEKTSKSLAEACQGISRTVVEEGQIHFADKRSAEIWIERRSRVKTTAWTNDGLFLWFRLMPSRYMINVDLMQICINGMRPKQLSGASDQVFVILLRNGSKNARHDCVQVGNDVIVETQNTLKKEWSKIDAWASHSK